VAEARLEAELLLGELLELDRGGLLFERERPLASEVLERFAAWVARREAREPLQQILGWQEFYGRRFRVDRRVLVPRPETELLIDLALELELPRGSRVADLGCGSGCIAVTLALECPGSSVIALDRSPGVLELTRENARLHGVELETLAADFGDAPPERARGSVDLLVSNPPYVAEDEWATLEPEVRDHEPRDALVPGPTGLEAHRALAPVAVAWLGPRGRLLLEIGAGQEAAVREILGSAGLRVEEVRPDLRGVPRAVRACRARDDDG